MFVRLIEMNGKHSPQAVATAAMKRGTPIDEDFIASTPKTYEGIGAVIDQKWVATDDIADGDIYNKVPTFIGERYATTELTPAGLSDGNACTVSAGKFIKGDGKWVYHGEYPNPYGVTMYIVEKVKA